MMLRYHVSTVSPFCLPLVGRFALLSGHAHPLHLVFRIGLAAPELVASTVDADGVPERHGAHRETARACNFRCRCVRAIR